MGKTEKKPSKKTSIEEQYKKKSHHEHILDLPDTYIGSIEVDNKEMWIYNKLLNKLEKKNIEFIPGLFKLFDEAIVNSRDHTVRCKKCTRIDVTIDKETNMISVSNNGTPIPIKIHKEHKIYVPELIFAHLLTSSNYEQKGKTVGGKNGYGAKLINIYSKEFIIDVFNKKNKKRYTQKFTNNMYNKEKPQISEIKNKKSNNSYTKISFIPDFSRFGIEGLSDDMISLFEKRVHDIAACTNNKVKVYLNNKLIQINTFEDYINMFYKEGEMPSEPVYEDVNDRWRVGVIYDNDIGFNHISYANGICTFQGGSHVNHVMDQVVNGIIKHIHSKHKKINVKFSHVKDNITVFIDSVIEDPSFTSQTKEFLSNKVKDFGSKCDLSDKFIQKFIKSGIVDEAVEFAKMKALSGLKKSDGKKKESVKGLTKLDDAHLAGSHKSKDCRLLLTEGDSAKAFAVSGLEVIGRDKYGVFPLKGKLLNVREATAKQLLENEEIKNIKKILGLKQNTKYDDVSKLRYGGIIILADQDVDGTHIKGLLINFFHYFWPSLIQVDGFIQSMATPIIKGFKKSDKKKKNTKIFYTLSEYNKWINKVQNPKLWHIKYYKGLGTSNQKEARECFNNFENNLITYIWNENNKNTENNKNELIQDSPETSEESKDYEDNDDDIIIKTDRSSDSYKAITLAFEKKNADNRKKWLMNYDPDNIIENNEKRVTYHDFVYKDLIHFSNYDNQRSIPSICDGFKPSQRKIFFGSEKRNLYKDEVKVSQLAGFISDQAAYHHGENSLQMAIVSMAHDFIGSNNINLLMPNGQFGTRRMGGKDCASARYLFTKLNILSSKIFRSEDKCIYVYIKDDGSKVEPVNYSPILPIQLINGVHGIGTGYSTSIPCFNPTKIVEYILKRMSGTSFNNMDELEPWYNGFTGKINKINGTNSFECKGKLEIINHNTIKVTEIPVGEWSYNYREYLDKLTVEDIKKPKKGKIVYSYKDNSGNNSIDITIEFISGILQDLIKKNNLEKVLKLNKNINISNMYLYNPKQQLTKYNKVSDILEDFYIYRLSVYELRKKYYVDFLTNQMLILKYKVQFIKLKIENKIIIEKRKKNDVLDDLEKMKFPKLSLKVRATDDQKTYNYITNMELFSLTYEKIEELNNEYNNKLKELEDYKKKTLEQLWNNELTEFINEYNKVMKDFNKNNKNNTKNKKKGKKGKLNKFKNKKIKINLNKNKH